MPKRGQRALLFDEKARATLDTVAKITKAIEDVLEPIALPSANFADCLEKTAFAGGSTNDAKGKTKSDSGGGDGTDDGSDKDKAKSEKKADASAADKPDDSPKAKLDAVAFQVVPADVVTVEPDKATTLKLVGGTRPYYIAAVDDGVETEPISQTDLFVSFNAKTSGGAGPHRVLVGDQAGARQIVSLVTSKKKSQKRP